MAKRAKGNINRQGAKPEPFPPPQRRSIVPLTFEERRPARQFGHIHLIRQQRHLPVQVTAKLRRTRRRRSSASTTSPGITTIVAAFARGIARHEAAVRAALTLPWSNGQITRLKLVKRQMHGRGRIDLLQARLIGTSPP